MVQTNTQFLRERVYNPPTAKEFIFSFELTKNHPLPSGKLYNIAIENGHL